MKDIRKFTPCTHDPKTLYYVVREDKVYPDYQKISDIDSRRYVAQDLVRQLAKYLNNGEKPNQRCIFVFGAVSGINFNSDNSGDLLDDTQTGQPEFESPEKWTTAKKWLEENSPQTLIDYFL